MVSGLDVVFGSDSGSGFTIVVSIVGSALVTIGVLVHLDLNVAIES